MKTREYGATSKPTREQFAKRIRGGSIPEGSHETDFRVSGVIGRE